MSFFTKDEAIKFLQIGESHFNNFLGADEFPILPRKKGGRYKFSKDSLKKWVKDYNSRFVNLDIKDYAKCLDFALAQHSKGYVMVDWGTSRQREFGQKVSNWIRGQLGELAVAKFFKKVLGIDIELDFEIYDKIVPQDVLSITKTKKRKPKYKIGIKSSKLRNAFLVLGKNEVEKKERKSDVYIFCRVDLPDDHLLRISLKDIRKVVYKQQHYPKYKKNLPKFGLIRCEVAGFAWIDELEIRDDIPSIDGERYAKTSGNLHRDIKDWKKVFSTK